MRLIDDIESYFVDAKAIEFFGTSDYKKEPPVIILVFESIIAGGALGYDLLSTNFGDKKATLVLFDKGDNVDVAIVVKDTADAINIKNLKFDKNQLDVFLKNEPKERKFAFVVGSLENGNLVMHRKENVGFVILDGFEIKKRPFGFS